MANQRARVDVPGQHGVVYDLPPHVLPAGAWTDARNVRFSEGQARRSMGFASLTRLEGAEIREMFEAFSGQEGVIACSAERVWTLFRTSTEEITGDSGPYDLQPEDRWTGGFFNGVVVLNSPSDPPQYWLGEATDQKLEDLPNFPSDVSCKVMRPFKNFLVMGNVTEDGSNYRTRVWWSDIADAGDVPSSWDYADPTGDAGFLDISDTFDAVVDFAPLRDQNIVYREYSIWGMQYTGGQEIFRFHRILSDRGVAAPGMVAQTPRGHFVVDTSDLYLFDGQNARSVLQGIARKWFYKNVNQVEFNRTHLQASPSVSEVYVVFTMKGEQLPSHMLVWNWDDGTVSIREAYGFTAGALNRTEAELDDPWDMFPDVWASYERVWGLFSLEEVNPRLTFAVQDGDDVKFVIAESGLGFPWEGEASFLERKSLPLVGYPDGPVDYDTRKMVKEVHPKVRRLGEDGRPVEGGDSLSMLIWVGAQNTHFEEPQWSGPYEYQCDRQRPIYCRVQGKIISIRFECEEAALWVLDGFDVVYTVRGKR